MQRLKYQYIPNSKNNTWTLSQEQTWVERGGGGCFLEIKAKKIETCVLILKVI
jgi:hypothetical protein